MWFRSKSAQPTHGWLIGNRLLRWFAGLFLLFLFVWFVAIWTVTYAIRRDCQQPYDRDLKLFGYWISVKAGSTKDGCPGP